MATATATATMTAFQPSYRKLSALNADFVKLAVLYTNNGREHMASLETITAEYIARYEALSPDTISAAAELPCMVSDLLAHGAGHFALEFRGTQLWVSNGTYGKQGNTYKWATYDARGYLKAHGFRWSHNRQAWYKRITPVEPAA